MSERRIFCCAGGYGATRKRKETKNSIFCLSMNEKENKQFYFFAFSCIHFVSISLENKKKNSCFQC
jgi:hypothetical protein